MLEWLAGWFLCVSVLAVVLLYLEVSCWLCCLYAHLNFMSRLNFVGGPMCWNTRTFSASAGGEAFCNGQTSHVSETDWVSTGCLGGVKPASRRPVAVAKPITGSLVFPGLTFPLSLAYWMPTPELHEMVTLSKLIIWYY
ncbi:hypothetical protein C5167_028935 [Papaver somniferum]|nr:hypothetical protein C5167_028935 [Papaver somniferum]